MDKRQPREPALRSFLLEAMNIVNSRPLTDVPVCGDDEPPLTPNHFLIGHTNSTQTPTEPDERLGCLRKQWRVSQLMKNHFNKRWVAEILPTLVRRSKWHEKATPLKPEQLVLICDPNKSRNRWKRGRIIDVFWLRMGRPVVLLFRLRQVSTQRLEKLNQRLEKFYLTVTQQIYSRQS